MVNLGGSNKNSQGNKTSGVECISNSKTELYSKLQSIIISTEIILIQIIIRPVLHHSELVVTWIPKFCFEDPHS